MGLDPISWVLIGGTVAGLAGGAMQVQQTQQNASYKREMGTKMQGAANFEAAEIAKTYDDVIAKQVTGFSANNVALSGSALDIMAFQAYEKERAVLMKQYAGELAAWRAGEEAQNLDTLAVTQGIGMFGTLMGGVAKVGRVNWGGRSGRNLNSLADW